MVAFADSRPVPAMSHFRSGQTCARFLDQPVRLVVVEQRRFAVAAEHDRAG
jgi:hypothetical protein